MRGDGGAVRVRGRGDGPCHLRGLGALATGPVNATDVSVVVVVGPYVFVMVSFE